MKPILDVCCGSRMMWFDKTNPLIIFGDNRNETHQLCDGRVLNVDPDVLLDFRNLEYADESFNLVVFDPPHLLHAGKKSWLALKYGVLNKNWKNDLRQGFRECFRVLKPNGVLIFKWSEVQIPVREILSLTDIPPLFGNRKGDKGHWIVFMKNEGVIDD